MTLKGLVLAGLMALGSAATAAAQEFDISFGPLTIGKLTVQAQTTAKNTYSVDLAMRTTGFAGAARPVRFAAQASGKADGWPQPKRYHEDVDTERRRSSADLVWRGAQPDITQYSAEPAETVPPADAKARKGAIDPASAVFAALTGPPLCGQSLLIFDGQRLNRIAFDPANPTAQSLTCGGRLTRLAGYPPKDIDERPGFDLSLEYDATGDTPRLIGAEVQTLYGKLRLKQR